ncbi:MAG: 3-hydroxyacyl-ACP dehydratase FabZ [Pseudomonadota bacterium]|nr:3-hydroxyacyl-ACP dehydratase FabZ [Pseudomonadota bacterium]
MRSSISASASAASSRNSPLAEADIARILELLPHRYPFLLIDRVIDMDGDRSATGIKNVTINEPFFVGHFPGYPVMPGVLLIEAMAQTAAALVMHSLGKAAAGSIVYFMSIHRARFRKPVLPGDTVHFPVKLSHKRPPVWKFAAEAQVEGRKVAEAQISAMLRNAQT